MSDTFHLVLVKEVRSSAVGQYFATQCRRLPHSCTLERRSGAWWCTLKKFAAPQTALIQNPEAVL